MYPHGCHKLITCFLPPGRGLGLLARLKADHGITEASVHSARGMGRLTPHQHRSGVGEQTEKEVLNVVVGAERADDIFAYLYEVAEIDRPHGGILFMSALGRATELKLPELPEEH